MDVVDSVPSCGAILLTRGLLLRQGLRLAIRPVEQTGRVLRCQASSVSRQRSAWPSWPSMRVRLRDGGTRRRLRDLRDRGTL